MEARSSSKTPTAFFLKGHAISRPTEEFKNLLSNFGICNTKTQSFYENLKTEILNYG
jgi:hypothetical protein